MLCRLFAPALLLAASQSAPVFAASLQAGASPSTRPTVVPAPSMSPIRALVEPHTVAIVDGIIVAIIVGLLAFLFRRSLNAVWKRIAPQEVQLVSAAGGKQEPVLDLMSMSSVAPLIDDASVFELLSWKVQLAPLTGYDRERAHLLQWVKSGNGRQICLLSGPGGVGKTRLAAEVAFELRSTPFWGSAGFPKDTTTVFFKCPALLIIDYPEERFGFTLSLLKEVSARADIGRPIRVLLLSRKSLPEWNADLDGASLAARIENVEMSPARLSDADAFSLYRSALDRLCDHFGATRTECTDADFAEWLARDPSLHKRPLFLVAAAIQTAIAGDAELNLNGREIVRALVRRELRRLREAAKTSRESGDELRFWDEEAAGRLAALAVVRGELDQTDLQHYADEALQIGLPDVNRVVSVVKKHLSPWWKTDHWEVATPDIVAAALVFEVLSERSDMAPEWLWSALAGKMSESADRLARLIHDMQTIYDGGGNRFLGWLTAIIDKHPERAPEFEVLVSGTGAGLLSLAPLGVKTNEVLLGMTDSTERRAEILKNLSIHLRFNGETVEALAPIEDAVNLFQSLAADDPRAFEPDLARSLTQLATILRDVGETTRGLAASEEALAIYRRLRLDRGQRFAPALAAGLNNLATFLLANGERLKALAPNAEAIAIARPLTQLPGGDQFQLFLAETLHIRSQLIDDVTEARAAIEEAVAIFRSLAQDQPQLYEYDLAVLLSNFSMLQGRTPEAFAASKEAVEIFRRLVQHRPKLIEPYLAASLGVLSLDLSLAGRTADAIATIREAIEIQRRLADDEPHRFKRDLAVSLDRLSDLLDDAHETSEAVAASQESVALLRRSAEDRSQLSDPGLALSLRSLSSRLIAANRLDEATRAMEESLSIRRVLAQKDPQRFESDLADILDDLSLHLRDIDKTRALSTIEESVAIYRRLAEEQPPRFEAEFINSLYRLSYRLAGIGNKTMALAASEEAVAICRRWTTAQPETFEPALAQQLNCLSSRLGDNEHKAEAVAAIEEAVEIYRRLARGDPERFEDRLADSLSDQSYCLDEVGETLQALASSEEAVEIFRRCYERSPGRVTPEFIAGLVGLAKCVRRIGDEERALKVDREIELLRQQHVHDS